MSIDDRQYLGGGSSSASGSRRGSDETILAWPEMPPPPPYPGGGEHMRMVTFDGPRIEEGNRTPSPQMVPGRITRGPRNSMLFRLKLFLLIIMTFVLILILFILLYIANDLERIRQRMPRSGGNGTYPSM
ncbi:hypothetical protein [Candidatus Similichlamydia laticola]|uniref:Uncharacterized protein n=1 Tax=Candidatus Similichlamydia laticola TaxID=2170265 RepID=A0A369KCK9_9BACT|nr:hypothetical protein [Candidatus Similichlamydia laticola]RDB31190.1 hypothetical protein HAT2_00670 [Candidatus Similichlamydia laticola]